MTAAVTQGATTDHGHSLSDAIIKISEDLVVCDSKGGSASVAGGKEFKDDSIGQRFRGDLGGECVKVAAVKATAVEAVSVETPQLKSPPLLKLLL